MDALRLARRFLAAELRLSFVPDAEQRSWRVLSRSKHQKRRHRVQLHHQIEALLEESQIKLSSVVTDLLGATGSRILKALARGESNPEKLVELAANTLKASPEQWADALSGFHAAADTSGASSPSSWRNWNWVDQHLAELSRQLGAALERHQQAVLAMVYEMPGNQTGCRLATHRQRARPASGGL